MTNAAKINLRTMLDATKAKDEGRPFISPLTEANPQSLDILFERVNSKLVQGLVDPITEADLKPVVDIFRSKRNVFLTEQAKKDLEEKPKRSSRSKVPAQELLELTDLSELEGKLS